MIFDVTTTRIDLNKLRDVFQMWEVEHPGSLRNNRAIVILNDATLQWFHENGFYLDLMYRVYIDNVRKFGEIELR